VVLHRAWWCYTKTGARLDAPLSLWLYFVIPKRLCLARWYGHPQS